MVVVVSGIHCLLVRCCAAYWCEFCPLVRSSSHEARHWCWEFSPWCLQTKGSIGVMAQLLAGDAQQLAASTACIGSELVACPSRHPHDAAPAAGLLSRT